MNGASVISKWETKEKDYFASDKVTPKFAIVDPQIQMTLPKEQVAYGVVDAYSHVLEQYINDSHDAPLQDRFAESILKTLVEEGKRAYDNTDDYEARSNFVYSATMALNNLIGNAVNQDWATHEIEHVISGHYDIPHGAGLAIIHPNVLDIIARKDRAKKLVKYGRNVWELKGPDEEIIDEAINRTREFFKSLGLKLTLTDWEIDKEESFSKLVEDCVKRDQDELPLSKEEIEEVLEACY
jgi:NADP-dependent alcohol dehydrogenase